MKYNKKAISFNDIASFGGTRGIRRAASGKPSTGRFSNPPFRIPLIYEKQKKQYPFQNITYFLVGQEGFGEPRRENRPQDAFLILLFESH